MAEVEITSEGSGATTVRRAEIAYDGDSGRITQIAFALNGADAGRMAAHYSGDRLTSVDVLDGDGDRGDIKFSYDADRVEEMQVNAPSAYTMTETYEYDDDHGGVPREVTTRMTPAMGQAQTSYRRFDHDSKRRLEKISDVVGESMSSVELRYDEVDRVERATLYANNNVVDTFVYAYDESNRVESVTGQSSDRWDVTYGDDGNIEEIRQISPGAGTTTTYRYEYRRGEVTGVRFAPDLPQASLFDLRGESFATVDFLSLTSAALSATVPSSSGGGGDGEGEGDGGGGGGGGGGGDDPLTCGPYTAETECDICDFTYCCPQVEVCAYSAECYPFWDCAAACQDAECYEQCGAMYPTGRAEYESYYSCSTSYCAAQCGP